MELDGVESEGQSGGSHKRGPRHSADPKKQRREEGGVSVTVACRPRMRACHRSRASFFQRERGARSSETPTTADKADGQHARRSFGVGLAATIDSIRFSPGPAITISNRMREIDRCGAMHWPEAVRRFWDRKCCPSHPNSMMMMISCLRSSRHSITFRFTLWAPTHTPDRGKQREQQQPQKEEEQKTKTASRRRHQWPWT